MKTGLLTTLLALCLSNSPAQQIPSVQDVNDALGMVLFEEGSLWEEMPETVASRLGWPEESRTSTLASYRFYPKEGVMIGGVEAMTMSLYGENGKTNAVSLVFANKGDVDRMAKVDSEKTERQQAREAARIYSDYKKYIRADAKTLGETLTVLFGTHKTDSTGASRDTRELVKRWDWEGHAFLLASPRDEYVALRIVPVETADSSGVSRIPRAEIIDSLAARVIRRENGDVVISEIPMVDQGPKGYCVPATWERVLRYMGIPADMYVLAMAGGTDVGGGTSLKGIASGVEMLVRRHGRRIKSQSTPINIRVVSGVIDKGLPLMWAMYSMKDMNMAITTRSMRRNAIGSMDEWNAELAPIRKEAKKLKPNPDSAHLCMIIGYNKETDEIAISDSWGAQFQERWMTVEEAQAISQGQVSYIDF